MPNDRLNARLPEPLAHHVAKMVSANGGSYETPSEYIRDLIRRDMEQKNTAMEAIREGYEDLVAGRTFESSGSFEEYRKRFAQSEANRQV